MPVKLPSGLVEVPGPIPPDLTHQTLSYTWIVTVPVVVTGRSTGGWSVTW
jgi:hypothetical protein